jgi:nucleotide-binding universal stress UspA family protein
MTPTVVCPLNSSPGAERAVPSAFDAAALLGAHLEFFSALEDVHIVERRRAYLQQIGEQQPSSDAIAPTINVVVDAHAPRAIAQRSAAADVVTVMATSSQPLLHTGYIGSAAEKVSRDAFNPTLLIGPHNDTRLSDVDRVVVPCDGSHLSEGILHDARRWADLLGIDLWVVTSISPRDLKKAGFDANTEPNYVRRIAAQVDAEWEVLHGPDPAKTIVKWAGDALIAMTTHGRSGLSRITVGSVTAATTRWATGPVLVANSQQSLSVTP